MTRSLEAGQGHSGFIQAVQQHPPEPSSSVLPDCRLQLVACPALAASCPKGAAAESCIQRQGKGLSPLLKSEETFLTSLPTDYS